MNKTIDKIDNYLKMGGLFNPESMEHHKVSDLLLECRDEIERLIVKSDKQAMILQHLNPEKYPGVLFIHGHLGEIDSNGLPEKLLIVPSYGCDWSQVYEKTERILGGMGS